jgi:peptide/nickel transport system permease protein
VVLWVIATILFLLFRLAPGDPTVAFIDPTFSEEQEQALRARFGLDKSLSEQYVIYLKNLAQGDLGDSFFRGATVSEMIMEALPNTLYLSFAALFLAYIVGVIGGTAMAVLRGGILEQIGVTITLMARALHRNSGSGCSCWPSSPSICAGCLIRDQFAGCDLPQRTGETAIQRLLGAHDPANSHACLLPARPSLLLMRSNMLEIMDQDFITMGRMVGYNNWRLMILHAARNALRRPDRSYVRHWLFDWGRCCVVENVFGWPGIGRMLVRAVTASDYPVAQGAFFVIALIIVALNFIADVLYTLLDPRIGASDQARAS